MPKENFKQIRKEGNVDNELSERIKKTITIFPTKNGRFVARVITNNTDRKEGTSIIDNNTPQKSDNNVVNEKMWYFHINRDYEQFKNLYILAKAKIENKENPVDLIKVMKPLLKKLIYVVDINEFTDTRKVCRLISNLLYKITKPEELTITQISVIIDCLDFIIDKNCSRENYIKVDTMLLKVNLDWLTGDKEYK